VFLSHFGAGFAAKKYVPYTSLGTLLLAAQLLDLLWPTLLALGYEQVAVVPGLTPVTPLDFISYPWSHSLLAAMVWSAAFAAAYSLFRRYPRGGLVIGALVASHWALDFVSHRPDLPLWPWAGPKVGLGLWYSRPATVATEGIVLAAGVWIYANSTEPTGRAGRVGLALFVVLLVAIYLSSVFGPPPPDASSIAWAGQAQWLLVVGGYWLDRHRNAVRQW
jgi:hypothetical protein